jgi:vancomycin resistance protein YoaR
MAATVERAYSVGRRGSIPERLAERAGAVFGMSVPAAVSYRLEIGRAKLEELAARVNEEPRGASVTISGSEVKVSRSEEGYRLDIPATMENLDHALQGLTDEVEVAGDVLEPGITTQEAEESAEKARQALSEQLVFKAEGKSWTLSPSDIGSALDVTRKDGEIGISLNWDRLKNRLANVYADLTIKPVEASYDFAADGSVIVKPSKEGQRIEEDKLLGAIEEGLLEGKREYEVPITVDKPVYTTAELESMKPTTLLGSYRTNHTLSSDKSEERVENLELASNAVSGTFVAPGEIFSMNDTVSHIDYNVTHVINGQETTEEGGGLC